MRALESTETAHPAPLHGSEHQAYYPALDGIRTIAVVLVFLAHYLRKQSAFGACGVDVFFVLSGFLITGILLRTRNSPHRLKNFYVRRTLRIFPLYYGIFFLLFLATPFLHLQWNRYSLSWLLYIGNLTHYLSLGHPPYQIPGYFTFHGTVHIVHIAVAHFWTLCVEEQFYLVWPFIVFNVASKRRLLGICLAVVAIVPFLRLAAFFVLPSAYIAEDMISYVTIFRMDALFLGAALALLMSMGEERRLQRFAMPVFATGSLLLFGEFVVLAHFQHRQYTLQTYWDSPLPSTLGLFLVDVTSAALVLLALRPKTSLYRALTIKPALWLGRRSYGFYIFHVMLLAPVQALSSNWANHRTLTTFVIGFTLTCLLCWASFRFYETPFLKLKDRFSN